MLKHITDIEDVTLPFNNGVPPTPALNYFQKRNLRHRCQRQINVGCWWEQNQYHFLSHIESLIQAYEEYQNEKEDNGAERCLSSMRFAIHGLRDIYTNYYVKKDEFKPEVNDSTELLMEYPKMSRKYIRVADEIEELTEEYEIGLTNNEDDKVIPGFENQPEFPSLKRKTIEPMYYHQEEKS